MVAPKPLVTLRGAVVLFLFLVVGLVVLGSGTSVVWGALLSDECMTDRPDRILQSESHITLFPSGVECVYLTDRGEVVGRKHYP